MFCKGKHKGIIYYHAYCTVKVITCTMYIILYLMKDKHIDSISNVKVIM